MADYQTTTERWTCPDCGHSEWAIVPSGCDCPETDTCDCGESKPVDQEHCDSCIELLNCKGCGCSIDFEDEGECIKCFENRRHKELIKEYLSPTGTVAKLIKGTSELMQVVENYRK